MAITEKICRHIDHPGDRLLPVTEFNKKGTGFQAYCRKCQKGYSQKHYGENKEYYAVKRDVWRAENS